MAKIKNQKTRQRRVNKKIPIISNEMMSEEALMIKNGLGDVLGIGQGGPGVQLSQTATLFKNNRWYLVSNMRQLISQIYVEIGLVQTIVDLPIEDGFRGGVDIKSKQLSTEQIQELQTVIEREDDIGTVAQASKWNRLYGGAGVLILTNQDPTTPLDLESLKEGDPLEFRDADMWELFWSRQNIEDTSVATGDRIEDATTGQKLDVGAEFYDYYGKKIHRSRVMILKGIKAPSFVRPRLRGWGVSVLETLVRSINQYLKSNDLGFEVLDEFKIDIYKIKDLANTLLSKDGPAQVRKRIALANQQKNYQHAIVMDGEDDYQQKQLTFAGLAEAMAGIRMQVASDMRMPITKLFGTSSAGFSSGEDDIENYNSMIESQIREKSKFDILRVIEIRCQTLFGMIPDDLSIEFKPLRILSSEQQENVKTQKFNRVLAAKSAGEITSKEFREACNKEDLLPIQLEVDDADDDLLSATNPDEAKELPDEAKKVSTTTAKEAPEAKV